MKQTREIPAESAVTNVYELPNSTWFPGTDAWAVVATADGRWYRVDLSGQYNDGVPELTELTALRDKSVTSLSWRTTSYTEGYTTYVGSDYLIARLSGNVEIIAWSQG